MSGPPSAIELLRAVAAHGLAGSARRLPDEPLDDDRWRELTALVRWERICGHLVAAITDGALPVTPAQVREALDLDTAALGHVLLLERRLVEVADAFEQADIDYRVLKGAAVAHTVYADPALRQFGDVDVLVPSHRFDDAAGVLERLGCRRPAPPLRAGFDRRFGKGVTFVAQDGLEVDLHRTLSAGFFGLSIDLEDLFVTTDRYEVGGRRLPALGREEAFLNACYHAAASHMSRLVPLRDVAEFVLGTDLDRQRVLERARHWRGEAVVARAVRRTWEVFALADVVPLSVWAERYDADRWERRALGTYRGPGRSEAARALTALPAIPGVAAKAAFLRDLLVPQRSYLDWVGQGRLRWLWRGRRALQRGHADGP